jgi:hypothetical protein
MTDLHTAEPLVPNPSARKIKMGTEKLKRHIPQEFDRTPTEFMQLGGRIACSGNQKLFVLYGTTKHCLCTGMSRSVCLFVRGMIKQRVLIVKAYHCYHKHTNFIEYSFVEFNCMCIICKQNYWGVDCNITDQLLSVPYILP